ncbi:16676_t:CDS:2 [Acaulospora morrowiae]|uniref:Restriction of telomere capping protein 5 n=1 Tax=Acaulospora morrowiae TaxID=94023 RepID=A0A9N9B0F2_9GLOM|nr:16676_t:CDS:2 [Acaulospora morrowiae]
MGQSNSNNGGGGEGRRHRKNKNSSKSGEIHGRKNSKNDIPDRIAIELERKNFTNIESFSLQATFENICKVDEYGVELIDEESFVSYIGFPEATGFGSMVYRSFSYLAGYPDCKRSNTPLTYEGFLKAVAIYCDKCKDVIKEDRTKLLFDSFSVSEDDKCSKSVCVTENPDLSKIPDDESSKNGTKVTCDDMWSILTGICWITDSELLYFSTKPEQFAAVSANLMSPETIKEIRKITIKVVESMARSDTSLKNLNSAEILKESIKWPVFRDFIRRNTPNIFHGFTPFFYTLFCIGQTLSQNRGSSLIGSHANYWPTLDGPSELLNYENAALLLWMLPKKTTIGRGWNVLYTGSTHGFSMNRFESHVFRYPGPTLILIHAEIVPPKRSSSSSIPITNHNERNSQTILLGAYVADPWRSTSSPKQCFGSEECFLFQLLPTYEVFRTTNKNTNYAYYNPSVGIGFGGLATSGLTSSKIENMMKNSFVLQLDNTLQSGRFKVDPLSGLAPTYSSSTTRSSIDIIFEVLEIEVVGAGGNSAKEKQDKEWRWEEAEATKRKSLRRSSKSVDKEILKLAGIINEDSRSER